jgi:ornithine lipid ester-linked acyl 2-hydroxylase
MNAWEKNATAPLPAWFSYQGGTFESTLPAFLDNTGWPWLEEAKALFPVFRGEIETLLTRRSGVLQPYFNSGMVNAGGKWEVVHFHSWGKKNAANCRDCPQLAAWLDTIPGLLSAGISRLAPHTEIAPHTGDTNTIARCHFGLRIPAGLPECGFRVNDETRAWHEGEWLVFCDAFRHSAWNKTAEARFVLIIDVVLPRFEGQEKDIAANVRSLLQLQETIGRKPWIGKLPGPLLGALRHWYKWTH